MDTKSNKLVLKILDTFPEAMIIADEHGIIMFANSNVATVFGYKPTEIIGQSYTILAPERHRKNSTDKITKLLTNSNTPGTYQTEAPCSHKDGSEFPAELAWALMKIDGILLISATIRDLSKRKEMEKELLRARDTAELANRAKTSFLTTASHDLRQPTQTLSMLISTLERLADTTPLQQIARGQRRALDTMAELLNALLDISKLETGAVKPKPTDFELKLTFEHMRNAFALQAQKKGIEFGVDTTRAIVHTDRILLERIIENLVGNAIRYTRQGKVWLRCIEQPAYIRVEVIDTGVGIPVSALRTIFNEFHQVRDTHDRTPNEGLGLGLAIVDRMVNLLNIPMDVQSTPGEGSTFAIEIPIGKGAADTKVLPSAIDKRKSIAGIQALVVDDDYGVLDSMQILLEIEGCKVTAATSLAEALEGASTSPPDIIITDYHLPDTETGMDVVQRVREQTGRPVPAILISGDTSSALRTHLLEGCLLLSKPVATDEFIASILDLV